MEKVIYETDPYNRLVARKTGEKSGVSKFRKVLDGQFKTKEDNNLYYHVKTPLSGDDNIPHQIKLNGKWSLAGNRGLNFAFDKAARDTFGDQMTLRGEIIDVKEHSILFSVSTKDKRDKQSIYLISLQGSWKADKNNRLTFYVKREQSRHDILTFSGLWDINKDHQIIYEYERSALIRKRKKIHTLTFKGHWDIKEKLRVSYVLGGDSKSVFQFKANAGVFKKNYIKYDIGIGFRNSIRLKKRTIELSGKWRLKKGVGLIFDVQYDNGKTRSIVFGAEAKLTGNDTISFRLKESTNNKAIGADLKLSHKVLGGAGEAFLRVLRSERECAIYAGAGWGW